MKLASITNDIFTVRLGQFITLCISIAFSGVLLAASNYQIYKQEIDKLPILKKENSRLVFYGTNYKWLGLLRGGGWKPIIILNGQNLDTPNNRNIYFVVDIPVGIYNIKTTNLEEIMKNGVSLPNYFEHTLGYTLNAVGGETYYHEMTISRGFLKSKTFIQYFLSLWRVEAEYAPQRIKRMAHWLKAEIEERNNGAEEE